ncbi:Coatomer/clathrin adaptor appendage, Ig-like subdomain-containing protein [Haematococcus lacustris]
MPSPSGVTYEAARPLGSLEHWYSQLLVKERGILYEDPHLQVGVQNRYSRSTGQLVLFLGNKHPEASLLPLQLRLSGPVPGLSITLGPAPQSLTPKQQVQVVLQLVSAAPFQGPPCLQLTYAVAGTAPVAVELRLPVLAHKFVVPEPAIPKEMFFEQWKASSTPPYKCQEMVERASPASIATVGAVTRLANLGVEHGYLDPSPCNEAGAGYFCYASNAGEQTVLVMARIEGNPQNMAQFRVTVVSQAPQVSAQLKDLIVSHLKLAPT